MKPLWLLVKRTFQKYGRDNCGQMAAAISYYVLFSLVPLTIVLVSIFGIVVQDADIRQDVIDEIIRQTPLNFSEGREPVEDTIRGVSSISGALGIVGLFAMLWSATAMFGAIRKSLNVAWGVDGRVPYAQGKLMDLAMVVAIGLLLGLSIAGTAALRAFRKLSDDALGPLSTDTSFVWTIVPLVVPAIVSLVTFLVVYRYIPSARKSFHDVWPGALVAAVLFELLKNGYAFYISEFNNYDVIYGALGGIFLFMLWTYLSASILLFGASLSVEFQTWRAGEYAAALASPGEGAMAEVRRFVRGIFFRERDQPAPKP
jgi:membrane protein